MADRTGPPPRRRVAAIMRDAGYGEDDIQHAEKMLMKQGIKRDGDVQALEDTAFFTFIRWYRAPSPKAATPRNAAHRRKRPPADVVHGPHPRADRIRHPRTLRQRLP